MEFSELIAAGFQYLIAHYPIATKVLAIMGAARLIFKPLCSGIQAYVDASEATWDNELWIKVKSNPAFVAFAYVLDFAFSIKLPK